MYSINKSAIISVNKNKTSIDSFSYDTKEYKKYFENSLKDSYDLNNDFENKDKLITSIKILEYDIYEIGEKDAEIIKKKMGQNWVFTTIIHRTQFVAICAFLAGLRTQYQTQKLNGSKFAFEGKNFAKYFMDVFKSMK